MESRVMVVWVVVRVVRVVVWVVVWVVVRVVRVVVEMYKYTGCHGGVGGGGDGDGAGGKDYVYLSVIHF